MSWLPAFHIGWWNAWLLMLVWLLHPLLMLLIDKLYGSGDLFKKMGDVPTEPGERTFNTIFTTLLFLLVVYSIFVPLKFASVWLLPGLALNLLGTGMLISALVTAARTPADRPFTSGVYRISRHPGYLAQVLTLLGVGTACASWIFLLAAGLNFIALNHQAGEEEQACRKRFGAEYQSYLKRTPRWLGFPKS